MKVAMASNFTFLEYIFTISVIPRCEISFPEIQVNVLRPTIPEKLAALKRRISFLLRSTKGFQFFFALFDITKISCSPEKFLLGMFISCPPFTVMWAVDVSYYFLFPTVYFITPALVSFFFLGETFDKDI